MSGKKILVLALAAGALLRIAYLITSRSLPFFDFPITDAWYHHRLAAAIASGTLWDGQPFFRAPLYPYLLGGLYALFGPQVLAGKILGHMFGLLTGGLVIAWAERLWGRMGAVWAAVLWLGSGLLLFYEGELLVDSVFTSLTFAALFLFAQSGENRRSATWSGALFGLAAITRPTVMVCIPLLLFWAYRRAWKFPNIGAWMLALAVPVGVVVGMNTYAVGRPAGIAMGGGINFYIGNHEGADGCSAVLPEPWGYAWNYRTLSDHASQVAGRPLDEVEVSDFYYAQGLAYIRDHPAEALSLAFRKAMLSVSRVSLSNNLNLPFVVDRLWLLGALAIRMYGVLVLAVAGWAWWRKLPGDARWLWGYVLCYFFVLVVYFTNERFRLPLVPALIVLAAGVPVYWLRSSGPERVRAVAAALLSALVVLPNWYGVGENPALAYFNVGNIALRRDDPEAAKVWFDSAAAFEPTLRQLHLNRGLARLRSGNLPGAREDFEREAALYPYDARPFNNLAALRLLENDTTAAMAAVDSGLSRDSTLGVLYLQRMRVAEAAGDLLSLETDLRLARRLAGDWPVWAFWQAEVARLNGQTDSARILYGRYLSTPSPWPTLDSDDRSYAGPDKHEVDYKVGLSYLAERNLDSAEAHFAAAALADSGFAEAWSNWGTAAVARGDFPQALERYRLAHRSQPESPVFLTNLAWAHLAMGEEDSALTCLALALRSDSQFVPALQLQRQVTGRP